MGYRLPSNIVPDHDSLEGKGENNHHTKFTEEDHSTLNHEGLPGILGNSDVETIASNVFDNKNSNIITSVADRPINWHEFDDLTQNKLVRYVLVNNDNTHNFDNVVQADGGYIFKKQVSENHIRGLSKFVFLYENADNFIIDESILFKEIPSGQIGVYLLFGDKLKNIQNFLRFNENFEVRFSMINNYQQYTFLNNGDDFNGSYSSFIKCINKNYAINDPNQNNTVDWFKAYQIYPLLIINGDVSNFTYDDTDIPITIDNIAYNAGNIVLIQPKYDYITQYLYSSDTQHQSDQIIEILLGNYQMFQAFFESSVSLYMPLSSQHTPLWVDLVLS